VDQPGTRICPRCRSGLAPKAVRLITLDECGTCRGLWFDRGEFDRAFKILTGQYGAGASGAELLAGGTSTGPAPADALPCPACGDAMGRRRLDRGGIEIDACSRCGGMWLDGGELDALRREVEKLKSTIDPETLDSIRRNPVPSMGVQMMGELAREMVTPRHYDRTSGRCSGSAGLLGLFFYLFTDLVD
jgi:Zn-finger nucleic acid-binding protein